MPRQLESVSGRGPKQGIGVYGTGSLGIPGSAVSGQKNVTTAGTAVALGVSTAIQSITIKAKRANTGDIYVGDSTVTSTNGLVLTRGEAVSFDMDNLADIFIDSSVNGEGVSFLYVAA